MQIYSSAEWYGSIVRTSKYKRGFKVPFAIDFGDWIMAFTSLDGITWVGLLLRASRIPQESDAYTLLAIMGAATSGGTVHIKRRNRVAPRIRLLVGRSAQLE